MDKDLKMKIPLKTRICIILKSLGVGLSEGIKAAIALRLGR
jgi:hypothetical protein